MAFANEEVGYFSDALERMVAVVQALHGVLVSAEGSRGSWPTRAVPADR